MFKKMSVALVLLVSAVNSFAACKQSDAAGRWDGVVSFTNLSGVYMAAKCEYNFDKRGDLTGGVCVYPNGSTTQLVGGQLNVGKNCAMTGSVLDNIGVITNLNANISRGKDSSVGTYFTNNGIFGTFSAVRY